MTIILVSSNPLFAEILSNTFLEGAGARVVQVCPELAPKLIGMERPAVIVVDESRIGAEELSDMLALTRNLPNSHTVLLNLQNNDVTIVSAQRATIRKVEDMVKVIRSMEEEQRNGDGGEPVLENLAAAAMARAGAYGFLALLCNQRPELSLVRRLRAVGVEGFLGIVDAEIAGELVHQGLQEMAEFVEQAAAQSDGEVEEMLAVDWTRLFRGVQPGYGPPPPYEGVYVGGDPLTVLRAIARVYREYGVAPAEGSAGDRPDYIGIELDFLRYVCEQQAAAHEIGDEAAIEKWSKAEEAFLQDHIGKWASAYCDQAVEEARTGFYGGAVHLIEGVVYDTRLCGK